MDDQPPGRGATLPGSSYRTEENRTLNQAQISAGCNNDGVITAQLEQAFA